MEEKSISHDIIEETKDPRNPFQRSHTALPIVGHRYRSFLIFGARLQDLFIDIELLARKHTLFKSDESEVAVLRYAVPTDYKFLEMLVSKYDLRAY